MRKFWNWKEPGDGGESPRTLFLSGVIAEESWFDDEVTPALFRDELFAGEGDVTVWINSPGGDCVAAAQIYNMLMDYPGTVTVKVDGLAASAASVVAMAGERVLMSPVSMLMVHNPATIAAGDSEEMRRCIQMLDEVKESIVNAYEIKTGMPRDDLSRLMDAETWMDAKSAVEYGFADAVMGRDPEAPASSAPVLFSRVSVTNSLQEKVAARCRIEPKGQEPEEDDRTSADGLMERLALIKHWR